MSTVSGSLDANVIIRLIIRDIPKQSDAAIRLIGHGKQFHIADTALIETVFALERYYNMPHIDIAEVMISFIDNPKFNLNKQLIVEALIAYQKYLKLSFEDCCLATYARLNSAVPLWTFDEKLAKQLNRLSALIK